MEGGFPRFFFVKIFFYFMFSGGGGGGGRCKILGDPVALIKCLYYNHMQSLLYWDPYLDQIHFDFIECFTTTFLRAHSWLNWVDEDDDEHDEVGLKEKPEDTRYIKKITSK